ncbi:unnamed protein product [Prunus armeniaca]|uniref:Uncharacterized protein n=1 Tax=Prunus armeniaca TaxID=36596 RepID=A0A6J5XTR5_PRUAR|nr:unnamed protein product [Prunus armeniaca]
MRFRKDTAQNQMSLHDRLIHVYHFTKDTAQNEMVPDEEFSKVLDPQLVSISRSLERAVARINGSLFCFLIDTLLFVQWKFAFLSLGRPEYL